MSIRFNLRHAQLTGAMLLTAVGGYLVGRSSSTTEAVSGGLRARSQVIKSPQSSASEAPLSVVSGKAPGNAALPTGTPSEQLHEILESLDASSRRAGLERLGALLGATQPEMGWTLIAMIPGLADRQSFAESLIKEWAARDPGKALAACTTLPAGELRAGTTAVATGVWADTDPQSAIRYAAEQLTASARRTSIAAVMEHWARKNPLDAAAWCLQNSATNMSQVAVQELMKHWANTDPKAGADWGAALPPGDFRDSALRGVIIEWADQYPEEAASWLAVHPGSAELTQELAQQWAAADPQKAGEWALKNSGQTGMKGALDNVAATWAAADPQNAVRWIGQINDPVQKAALEKVVVYTWSADDPMAALKWAQSLRDTNDSLKQQDAVYQSWSETAPDGLAQRVEQLPRGREQDTALAHLAEAMVDVAPQQAINQALRIGDPQQSIRELRRVFSHWQGTSPNEASAWLQQNPEQAINLQPRPKKLPK